MFCKVICLVGGHLDPQSEFVQDIQGSGVKNSGATTQPLMRTPLLSFCYALIRTREAREGA